MNDATPNIPYTKSHEPGSDFSGLHYLDFLSVLSSALTPSLYLEIGTNTGDSVSRFSCDSICIDPHFQVNTNIIGSKRRLHLFQMTSDDYFSSDYTKTLFHKSPDIFFLDGMHRYEYLLRDLINSERAAHSKSLILMHDCLPLNERMALRVLKPGPDSEGPRQLWWTGDVWKIIPMLKKYRPDLRVCFIDCPPTGLVAIYNVKSESPILRTREIDLVQEFRDLDLNQYGLDKLLGLYPMLDSKALNAEPHNLSLFFDIRNSKLY